MTSKNTICIWYEGAVVIGDRPLMFSETQESTRLPGRKCLKRLASARVCSAMITLNPPRELPAVTTHTDYKGIAP